MRKLQAADIIDAECGFHYANIRAVNLTTEPHCHDFFELFIISQGSIYHLINGQRQLLHTGTLVFMRPDDEHSYENLESESCTIVNVAIDIQVMDDLFRFIGPCELANHFLHRAMPLERSLFKQDQDILLARFHDLALHSVADRKELKAELKVELKALLIEILFRYFQEDIKEQQPIIPHWLRDLRMQVMDNSNYTKGLSHLYSLSDKSPEHMSRSIRKYYGQSPTEWLNEFKLQHAANLLQYTNEDIMSISLETGFDNLSHFYHLFKQRYQISPGKYRKLKTKVVIPE